MNEEWESNIEQNSENDSGEGIPMTYLAAGGGCFLVSVISACMTFALVILFALAVSNETFAREGGISFNPGAGVEDELIREATNTPAQAIELMCGDTKTGNLNSNQTAQWYFEGQEDDMITLSIEAVDSSLLPDLILEIETGEDSRGEKWPSLENSRSQIEDYRLPATGIYNFFVRASSGQGEYAIALTCQSEITPTQVSVETTETLMTPTFIPTTPAELEFTDPFEPTPVPGLSTGDVQITLVWFSTADMDVRVIDPFGEEISYENATSASGGMLDSEANGFCSSATSSPVENIVWRIGTAPAGEYTVNVNYFGKCRETGSQDYEVIVRVDGEILEIGSGKISHRDMLEALKFTYE